MNPNFPDHMTGPENGWQFVCGCDGVTYSGWEQRARAATSVRGEGPCCDESKLNFTRDNAPGFSEFRVCMHGKLPSGLSPSIKAVLDAATFGTAGEGAQCPEGDSAWVGKLTKAPDGSFVPDQFMALCRLADIDDRSRSRDTRKASANRFHATTSASASNFTACRHADAARARRTGSFAGTTMKQQSATKRPAAGAGDPNAPNGRRAPTARKPISAGSTAKRWPGT